VAAKIAASALDDLRRVAAEQLAAVHRGGDGE
jgi:hypothetical protein